MNIEHPDVPMSYFNKLVLTCLLMLPLTTASGQGLTDVFMSPADEKRIGAQEHEKILAQFGGAYDDPELTRYVDSIGQFLVKTSSAANVGFTFTVLNTPVVNAFALPGGYVYVTRGLVALATSEAELAGVIAHEIGHVAARHGAERQTKGTLANIGLLILGAATDSNAAVGLGQLGASAVLSSYSREDEFEADTLGVQYLSRAGFSPEAMASFLRKLRANDQLQATIQGRPAGGGMGFFATHPRTTDRVRKAIENASQVNVSDPIVARQIYYQKIDGMLYGDDPAQGLIRGRRFLHPDLRLDFTVPEGFRLINTPAAVIAQGPGGAGIKFDIDFKHDGKDMVQYLHDYWAAKARVRGLKEIRVGDRRAAIGTVAGIQNGRADAHLVAIYTRKHPHRFVFVIPRQNASQLNHVVSHTLNSFRRLPAADAQALGGGQRLIIHQVVEGETVEQLAERMPFEDYRLQRFLLLNGFGPDRELRAGQRVKLISE